MIIFSGGLPYNNLAKCPPSITIINGRSTTVLEMEGTVVDFVVLCETPWRHGKLLIGRVSSFRHLLRVTMNVLCHYCCRC